MSSSHIPRDLRVEHCTRCPVRIHCETSTWPDVVFRDSEIFEIRITKQLVRCNASSLQYVNRRKTRIWGTQLEGVYEGVVLPPEDDDG